MMGSLPEEELVHRHTPLMQATAASLGQDVATALTQMATMAHASGTTLLTPSENARYRQQEAERIFRNIIESIATGGTENGNNHKT
jgi:dihydrodipicolinate synthase/N-acetylneuraminate lyase